MHMFFGRTDVRDGISRVSKGEIHACGMALQRVIGQIQYVKG
jgi:hypothetical protein